MEHLLESCNTPSSCIDDFFLGGRRLSPYMRDAVSSLATGHLAKRPKPTTWNPPGWSEVEKDLTERSEDLRNIVPLGKVSNILWVVDLEGQVQCHGEGEQDIIGLCTPTIDNEEASQKMEVKTLGTVGGTGTGVFLDRDGNV
jgi:hypothetical protein